MNALTIQNLSKIYKTGTVALKNIDLEVKDGDFFGLLGPNGAGKSTLISIISSIIKKTSGLVKVYSADIDIELSKAKSSIGIVPQEFNFNIFEKVIQIVVNQGGYYGLPRQVAKENAERILQQLGIWDKRNSAAGKLSGGMKRRLVIARALVHDPKILILDEPTAGVDIELRRSLWDFLKNINAAGKTIILTTHYLEEAELLCKKIAIIDQGKIIENTSTKNLLSKLHTETFILDLDKKIIKDPKIKEFKLKILDPLTLEVDITKKSNLNSLFKELDKNKISVKSLKNKTNRLEELFLKLVEKK